MEIFVGALLGTVAGGLIAHVVGGWVCRFLDWKDKKLYLRRERKRRERRV